MLRLLVVLILFKISMTAMALGPIVFLHQNSAPKFFPLDSGKKGLCNHIYEKIAFRLSHKNLNFQNHHAMLPIKRILSMLETGEGHIFCGAGKNPEREKLYIYSPTAIYEVSNVVVGHKDEMLTKFEMDYFLKNKVAVGAYFGTTSAKYLRSQIGDLAKDHFTNIEDALFLVNAKRLRFFYYHDLGLNHYVHDTKYSLQVMSPRFRTVPQWMIYSKKTPPAVIKAIDEVLHEMKDSGELQKLRNDFY
ncbi:substrate-binding periplasmic protein [Bacteriovorax sp. BSW11_IV]|uniref:substrate-binding periplasmic protein n=1 Tax=Bacteriovorax sp. BSW11_IV TaxID=1353529 RepID=UPI0009DBC41F